MDHKGEWCVNPILVFFFLLLGFICRWGDKFWWSAKIGSSPSGPELAVEKSRIVDLEYFVEVKINSVILKFMLFLLCEKITQNFLQPANSTIQ